MGFYSTTLVSPEPHQENSECSSKTASRDFFRSNRNHVYKIERNPLELQQEKLQTTYKTASGRSSWLGRDPIEEKGGVNLYAFVRNNGINLIDILGAAPLEKANYNPQFPTRGSLDQDADFEKKHKLNCGKCKIEINITDAFYHLRTFKRSGTSRIYASEINLALKFDYKLTNPDECKCAKLRIVQAVRRGRYQGGRFVSSSNQGGTRSAISDRRTGWRLDWPKGIDRDRPPFFDELPLSSPAPGDGSGSGSYWDPPGIVGVNDAVELSTCFIAEREGENEVIGCFNWAFTMTSRGSRIENGQYKSKPFKAQMLKGYPNTNCDMSDGLKSGLKSWNSNVDDKAKINLQ